LRALYRNQRLELIGGEMPQPPESWDEFVVALEDANRQYRQMIADTPDAAVSGGGR
jgi:hypothetical protein